MSESPAPQPAPQPAQPAQRRGFRLRAHDLIFVGMVLGVVLGLLVYALDHHDQLQLADGTALAGQVRQAEGEYVVRLPSGEEQRVAAERVAEWVKADETTSGQVYGQLLWWLNLLGSTVFVGALKMLMIPLTFASIVAGIVSIPDMLTLRRVGTRTVAYYMITTTIAVALGLVLVHIVRPGHKESAQAIRAKRAAELEERAAEYERETGAAPRDEQGRHTPTYLRWLAEKEAQRAGSGHESDRMAKIRGAQEVTPGEFIKQSLLLPILRNPFQSLAEANALGVIAFAVLLGLGIVGVGPPAAPVAAFFTGLSEVMIQVTRWVMIPAPFCVACIVAELVGRLGPDVFAVLAWYAGTVIGGILLHMGILTLIAWKLGGRSPAVLWSGVREAIAIAFTTRSSAATLPVSLRCSTRNLGVPPRIANFSIPLGCTVNMDGTALYEGVAVIFLLQIYDGMADVPALLGGVTTLLVFVTATVAAIGAAAVPEAGLITMALVAGAVGLPAYYIPLVFAVDAFLDMFRTSANVLGDMVGSTVVHRLVEGPEAAAAAALGASGAEAAVALPLEGATGEGATEGLPVVT